MLTKCAIQSICDYLATPNGTITILGNAPGCNSQEEVEEACGMVGVSELQVTGYRLKVELWPNPAGDEVVISVSSQQSAVSSQMTLRIYDMFGREVRRLMDEAKSSGEYTVKMDVSDLPAGVYMIRLQVGSQSAVEKLIVQ